MKQKLTKIEAKQRAQELIDVMHQAEKEAYSLLRLCNVFTGARQIALRLGCVPGTAEYRIALDTAAHVFEQYDIVTNEWGIICSVERK